MALKDHVLYVPRSVGETEKSLGEPLKVGYNPLVLNLAGLARFDLYLLSDETVGSLKLQR